MTERETVEESHRCLGRLHSGQMGPAHLFGIMILAPDTGGSVGEDIWVLTNRELGPESREYHRLEALAIITTTVFLPVSVWYQERSSSVSQYFGGGGGKLSTQAQVVLDKLHGMAAF